MQIASIGIDLDKATFHLVALGERNKILARKTFSRATLLTSTANLPASLIGLEACAGAHFLGSALRAQFTNLTEALSRYRGKVEQKMTVEHVHVYQGGQAIVGQVSQNNNEVKLERTVGNEDGKAE